APAAAVALSQAAAAVDDDRDAGAARPPLDGIGEPPVTQSAVLFDLDDTLVDHRGASRAALAEVHRRHAGGSDFEVFEGHHVRILDELHPDVLAGRRTLDDARRERFRRVFEAIGIRLSAADSHAVAAAYRASYVPAWRAPDRAAPPLERIRPHARIGVISNNLIDESRDKLAFCGLTPFVDALVVSGSEGVSKPDPRIFHIALERLGVTMDRAVMFGDSWAADVAGAAR